MKCNENSPVLQDVVRWLRVFTAYEQGLSQISCPAEAAEMLADWQAMDVDDIPPALLGSDGPALLLAAWNTVIAPDNSDRPGTVSARLNNPEEYTTMRTTTIDKKEEEETMKKYFIQFESGEGRDVSGAVNYLVCLDNPDLYAEIPVPDGASDDYGYLALKDQILDQAAAAGIDRSALEFWYDGQEQYLSQDASAGRAPRRISVDNGAHFVDPTVSYAVHQIDEATGTVTRIDIIDVPEGYTAADYIRACEEGSEPAWVDLLHSGPVSLVRLRPDADNLIVPLDVTNGDPDTIAPEE